MSNAPPRSRTPVLVVGIMLLVLGPMLVAYVLSGYGLNVFLPVGALFTVAGIVLTVGAVRRRPGS